jgi:hypothetical protein
MLITIMRHLGCGVLALMMIGVIGCSDDSADTSAATAAVKPDDAGGGKPPDTPGGGGKPDDPGGGGGKPAFPGRGQGDLYSDLVALYRDEVGRPILIQKELLPEEPGGESPGTVFCLQPISASPVEGLVTVTNPADGKQVSLVELGTGLPGEECDLNPDPDNVALVQEILFGRLNLGRSPTKVLAQQLRDVTGSMASSALPIEIEEAGRFVWYATLDLASGVEVDSPGQNLSLHKELQVEGLPLTSQTQTVIDLPDVANASDPSNFLDHAAAALGAAAGKGDLVDLNLVIYDNRILNIPNETLAAGTLATVVGGQVMDCPVDLPAGVSVDDQCQYGQIVATGPEVYIDYGAEGYDYTRSDVFPGCVRGLLADFPIPGTFTPFSGSIMDCVFGTIDLVAGNGVCSAGVDFTGATAVHGFAQRADDARAVIAFVHGNAVADSTALLPVEQAGVDQAGQTAVCDDLAAP